MNATTNITIDLISPQYVTVYEPQGNVLSRFVQISLTYNGSPWTIPSGTAAVIKIQKPDGTFAFYDTNEKSVRAYTISGSTITIELVGNALAVSGDALANVELYNSDGSRLSGFAFRLMILPSPVDDDTIINSGNYVNVITALLTEAAELIDQMAQYGVVPATEVPLADSTNGAVGTSTKYAREDHRHPLPTASNIVTTSGATVQASLDTLETYEAIYVTWTFSSSSRSYSDSRITADMRVVSCVFGNPSYITTDITWTTAAGSVTLAGTVSAATTVSLILAKCRT